MSERLLSPEAEQDFIDIWLYIAEDNPVNADNYIDELHDKGYIIWVPLNRCYIN